MKCQDCGKKGERANMVIDHIMPLSRGGSRDPENMRLVHARCHHKKLAWYQYVWKYITQVFWRVIPHNHGSDNMEYKGVIRMGQYQIYECKKCGFTEAM